MNDRDPTGPGSGPSDDRISRLSAAILRISQSLDVATVLEEVVESARALTGARSGVITTIDEQGEVQDFVTSGLSPEEYRKMVEWSDGRRLFEHLRDQAKPLRVADLPGYLDSLGLSPTPWTSRSLHGTPMQRPASPAGPGRNHPQSGGAARLHVTDLRAEPVNAVTLDGASVPAPGGPGDRLHRVRDLAPSSSRGYRRGGVDGCPRRARRVRPVGSLVYPPRSRRTSYRSRWSQVRYDRMFASMDAPDNASISSNGWVHVVRCCRLSGLLVQPVVSEAAGPYGDTRTGSISASQA